MSASIDETLRIRSHGERVVRRNGAVKSNTQHFPAQVAQRLSLVLRIVTVFAQLGILVILTGGDVKQSFGRMSQESAAHMLSRRIPVPFQQALLARRV